MNEHRDSIYKNVEQHVGQKTEQLERLITPLKNCIALSDKIKKEVAILEQELARITV